eukprot:7558174-Pyramimonas_sp.AAC.1
MRPSSASQGTEASALSVFLSSGAETARGLQPRLIFPSYKAQRQRPWMGPRRVLTWKCQCK